MNSAVCVSTTPQPLVTIDIAAIRAGEAGVIPAVYTGDIQRWSTASQAADARMDKGPTHNLRWGADSERDNHSGDEEEQENATQKHRRLMSNCATPIFEKARNIQRRDRIAVYNSTAWRSLRLVVLSEQPILQLMMP